MNWINKSLLLLKNVSKGIAQSSLLFINKVRSLLPLNLPRVNNKYLFSYLRIIYAVFLAILSFFSWLSTLWRSLVKPKASIFFALGFIFLFTVSGVTGVVLVNPGIGIGLQDTSYVTGHFHCVLSMCVSFLIFAGLYYRFNNITGLNYSEFLGQLHFWLFFIGVNLTFSPMYFLGVAGMPLKIPDCPETCYAFNNMSFLGYCISVFSVLIFILVLIDVLSNSKKPEERKAVLIIFAFLFLSLLLYNGFIFPLSLPVLLIFNLLKKKSAALTSLTENLAQERKHLDSRYKTEFKFLLNLGLFANLLGLIFAVLFFSCCYFLSYHYLYDEYSSLVFFTIFFVFSIKICEFFIKIKILYQKYKKDVLNETKSIGIEGPNAFREYHGTSAKKNVPTILTTLASKTAVSQGILACELCFKVAAFGGTSLFTLHATSTAIIFSPNDLSNFYNKHSPLGRGFGVYGQKQVLMYDHLQSHLPDSTVRSDVIPNIITADKMLSTEKMLEYGGKNGVVFPSDIISKKIKSLTGTNN